MCLRTTFAEDETTTNLLVQSRNGTAHFCTFVSSRGTSPVLQRSALTFDSACACDSLYRQWAHFYGFFAKPAFLNPIAHALTRGKRVKVHSVQRRLSEGHLFSIVATNHAFLLVSIDMPDHSLHASHSRWFPKLGPDFSPSSGGIAPWPAHSRRTTRSQGAFPARATTRGATQRRIHLLLLLPKPHF